MLTTKTKEVKEMKKFAIVGCGFISKKHAEAIEKIENAQLIAVYDMQKEKMKPYVERYNAIPYENFNEMLNNTSIDIVCVCTPSGLHAAQAVEAAKFGKHLIVEKPIAMTLDDANSIKNAAMENNVKLSIVHPNRFRPVAVELKKILDEDKLGKISHANCIINWNRGQEYYNQAPWRGTKEYDGGVLMNQAIHNIDLLLWYLGEPEDLFSMEATRIRDIEAEDVSLGMIRFKNGVLANVQAASTVYAKNFEESITIFGEKGTVKIGGGNALYLEHLIYEGMDNNSIEKIRQDIIEDPWGQPGHQKVYENLIESLDGNSEIAVTGDEAIKSLKLVLKMYESASLGKKVKWDNTKEKYNEE